MKIDVDLKRCELHGQCVYVAPELFRIENDILLFEASVPDDLKTKALAAAKVCPQLAITIKDN
jgi:ferredoxin